MMYFNIFFYTEPVSAFLDHFSQNLEIQRSTLLALKSFHSSFLLMITTVYTSSSSSSNAHLGQTTIQSIQQHTRFAPFLARNVAATLTRPLLRHFCGCRNSEVFTGFDDIQNSSWP